MAYFTDTEKPKSDGRALFRRFICVGHVVHAVKSGVKTGAG
jgi:hypothetical protein